MAGNTTGGGSQPASLATHERRALPAVFTRWWHALRELYARPSSALGTTLVLVFLAMASFVVVRSLIAEPVPTLSGLATCLVAWMLYFPLKTLNVRPTKPSP